MESTRWRVSENMSEINALEKIKKSAPIGVPGGSTSRPPASGGLPQGSGSGQLPKTASSSATRPALKSSDLGSQKATSSLNSKVTKQPGQSKDAKVKVVSSSSAISATKSGVPASAPISSPAVNASKLGVKPQVSATAKISSGEGVMFDPAGVVKVYGKAKNQGAPGVTAAANSQFKRPPTPEDKFWKC